MGNLVTAKELASYLKLTEATIYKLASQGKIPGFKIGDSWRFEMDEILMMLQRKKLNKRKMEKQSGSILSLRPASNQNLED